MSASHGGAFARLMRPRPLGILLAIVGLLILVNVAQADADATQLYRAALYANAADLNGAVAARQAEVATRVLLEYAAALVTVSGVMLSLLGPMRRHWQRLRG